MAKAKTLVEKIKASIALGNTWALEALKRKAYEYSDKEACLLVNEALGYTPDETDTLYWEAVNERDAKAELSGRERVSSQKPAQAYNMTLNDARMIVNDSTTNEKWRRSLIARYRGAEYANNLDYSGLLSEGNKIINYAKRMLGIDTKGKKQGGA